MTRIAALTYADHDFEQGWNQFLEGYEQKEVETLKDIVRFNTEHSDKALPERNDIIPIAIMDDPC